MGYQKYQNKVSWTLRLMLELHLESGLLLLQHQEGAIEEVPKRGDMPIPQDINVCGSRGVNVSVDLRSNMIL